eukprot:IDg7962t1
MEKEIEEDNETRTRLYFDTLDIGAAETIVRQLSAIPNSILWHNYVDIRQVLKLYSMDGVLSAVSRNMFNGIYDGRGKSIDTNNDGIRSISCEFAEFNDKTLDKLSQAAGTSFKRLVFTSESSEFEVKQNGLRLCARFQNRTRVWELVGGHLEKLKFCVLFSDRADKLREEVRKIPQHCRHLRDASIRLTPSTFLRDEVAQCYATYGAQLLHAHAFGMTPAQCNVIQSACPNAVLSIQLSNRDSHLALSLRAAAPFAQRVTIDCHYRAAAARPA